MISLSTLSTIYNRWGDKNNLQPLASADAELWRNDLTNKQIEWLQRFIYLWNITERIKYERKS
jgi:hypothetical protein